MSDKLTLLTGLLGGMFDPPHNGHLTIAERLRSFSAAAEVWFVPSVEPPHRSTESISPYAIRRDLVKSAVHGHQQFSLCEIESTLPAPHYTVRTLKALSATFPEREWLLFIGADQLAVFDTWHEPEQILSICRVIVAARPGVNPSGLFAAHPRVQICPDTDIPLSSSMIRRQCAQGTTVDALADFMPRSTAELIVKQHLYGSGR